MTEPLTSSPVPVTPPADPPGPAVSGSPAARAPGALPGVTGFTSPPDGLPPLLDVPAVAAWLGLAPNWIRAAAGRKAIPAVKVGGAWRFSRETLGEWWRAKEAGTLPRYVPVGGRRRRL
ncbi:MAG: helix-turn-helix domain-containing protein [Planctomycetales bacterium]|nr:helix-turn-helix domain-containing protein [Planctomycetales bacterium]